MRSPSLSVLALAGLIATSAAKIPFVATSDVIPLPDSSDSSSASTSASAAVSAATAVSAGVAAIPVNNKRSARRTMASRRQASNGGGLCTVIGSTALPAEVATVAASLADSITCSSSQTTIAKVPDATSGSTSFSSVDFSTDAQKRTPLQFALDEFATDDADLAATDLQTFQDKLDVYLATEAGIRSVGGSLAIKVPKFFLQMQVSRIQTAQGNPPTEAGQQVDHLRDKVIKNAAGESQALLDQVTKLATQVS
ncbi:hypothetical protein F4809DRAFT_362788 [Biscogniauxia mediterranea]|nr:hypothetical protein F4809DRAFT_362788 [Biscogniauxia mediterranea]